MTQRERLIAERLRAAADRVSVDVDVTGITDGVMALAPAWTVDLRPRRMWRPLAAAAVALVAVGAVAVGVRDDGPVSAVSAAPPITLPASAPVPGSIGPHSDAPPAWVGQLDPAHRQGALRAGRWVSTAFAIPADDGFDDPIVVAVFEGDFQGLSDATPIVHDGQPLRSIRFNRWEALFTAGSPTIMVSGDVGTSMLAAVLHDVSATSFDGALSVQVDRLPDGYVEIVEPHALGPDVADRLVLADEANDIAINEVSDLADPLLAAALSGGDLMPVVVGEHTGWAVHTDSNPYGPLTSVVWSPQSGVVLEVVTGDATRSTADLAELAATVRAISLEEWEGLHP